MEWTDDPREVANARAIATEALRKEGDKILAHPSSLQYVTARRLARLASVRMDMEDELRNLATDSRLPLAERAGAAVAMLRLDCHGAAELMMDLALSVNCAEEAAKFMDIVELEFEFGTSEQTTRFRDSDVLRDWLRRWYVVSETRIAAGTWCERLALSFSDEREIDPSTFAESHALMIEAKRHPTTRIFEEVIARILADPKPERATWLWEAMRNCPRGMPLAGIHPLLPIADNILWAPRYQIGSVEYGAIALVEAQSDAAAHVLRQLAERAPNPGVRVLACRSLSRVDPDSARAVAMEYLQRQGSSWEVDVAAESIRKMARGAHDVESVNRLALVRVDLSPDSVCMALLAIGGAQALREAERRLPYVAPETATIIKQAMQSRSREDVVAAWVEAGIFSWQPAGKGLGAMQDIPGPYTPWIQTFLRGTGLFLVFDAEAPDSPPRYDELLHSFADHSGGVFAPESVVQKVAGNGDDVQVQFIHARRLYRFSPAVSDEWFDVPTIANAVNLALSHSGAAQRFFALRSDGQCPHFLCVPAIAFPRIAAETGWTVEVDLNAAAKDGQAFEQEIAQRLKNEGNVA